MGNSYSFESLNPERYEEVRLSSSGLFGQCSTVNFPFDRKPTNLRDSALWDEFGKSIDEELPNINKHYGLVLAMTPVPIVIMGLIGFVGIQQQGLAVFLPFVAFLLVAALSVFFQIRILKRNQEVDGKIREICAKNAARFQVHGIVPEYRTKWTELCKPKGAIPLRMIVFRPSSHVSA